MSVNIFGNRDVFLSKTAILRLKTDIKEKKSIDPAKYLKEGFVFKIENNNNDTNVYIKESVIIESVEPTPILNELEDANKKK